MNYGFNLFTKREIDKNKLIEQLDLDPKKTLFVNENNDWAGFDDNITTIIENNGLLEADDHEKYTGYIYYDISTDIGELKDAFDNIKNTDMIIEQ